MFSIIKKIWKYRWVFRSLPLSIYFNFHYLPFYQACRLPILLYKPHLKKLKGQIIIENNCIKPGIITLGINRCSLYPNNGIMFENKGGNILFKGSCVIGNGSAISVGEKGTLEIGNNFVATTQFRCVVYHKVVFGDCCRFGWDCLVMDTDFHRLKKEDGGYTKGYGPIKIGSNNWIGSKSFILKNTETSDYCIVAGGTRLSGKNVYDNRVIIGYSKDVVVQKEGYWRDVMDDSIEY